MFAIIYIGGKQIKVREKDEVEVELMEHEPGKNFEVNEVLLMGEEDGSDVKIGLPFVAGAHVECQVMEHTKADKVRVFKFNPKKRYHKTQGHRQNYTMIKVLKISAVGGKKAAKMESPKAVEEGAEEEVVKTPVKAKKVTAKKTTKKAA